MTEDAKEQAPQAEATPSQAPAPPRYDPDPDLMEVSQRYQTSRTLEQEAEILRQLFEKYGERMEQSE